jgi:hypothetical protein
VQGAVRIHESELSHSVISVARLTETTLDSATGPFRADGISIGNVEIDDRPCPLGVVFVPLAQMN